MTDLTCDWIARTVNWCVVFILIHHQLNYANEIQAKAVIDIWVTFVIDGSVKKISKIVHTNILFDPHLVCLDMGSLLWAVVIAFGCNSISQIISF